MSLPKHGHVKVHVEFTKPPRAFFKACGVGRHCSKEWELMEVSSYEAHQVGPLCWPMNETLAAHLRFVLQARGFKSIDMFLWQDWMEFSGKYGFVILLLVFGIFGFGKTYQCFW